MDHLVRPPSCGDSVGPDDSESRFEAGCFPRRSNASPFFSELVMFLVGRGSLGFIPSMVLLGTFSTADVFERVTRSHHASRRRNRGLGWM